LQTGDQNWTWQYQQGINNLALTQQTGDENTSLQLTWGDDNYAEVDQQGESNLAEQFQGTIRIGGLYYLDYYTVGNEATILQDGIDNFASQRQTGPGGHFALTVQNGNGNSATTTQTGDNHYSSITQNGNGNTAVVTQMNAAPGP
jgi:hypothetical protein